MDHTFLRGIEISLVIQTYLFYIPNQIISALYS